jgi:hypothetical protein
LSFEVGCNQKDEYSSEFKWWEYSFNRSAQKIAAALEPENKSKSKKRKHEQEVEEKETTVQEECPKKTIYSRFEKVRFNVSIVLLWVISYLIQLLSVH